MLHFCTQHQLSKQNWVNNLPTAKIAALGFLHLGPPFGIWGSLLAVLRGLFSGLSLGACPGLAAWGITIWPSYSWPPGGFGLSFKHQCARTAKARRSKKRTAKREDFALVRLPPVQGFLFAAPGRSHKMLWTGRIYALYDELSRFASYKVPAITRG